MSKDRTARTILTEVPGCCPHRASDTAPLPNRRDVGRADIIACRYCGKMLKNRYGELSVLDLEGRG